MCICTHTHTHTHVLMYVHAYVFLLRATEFTCVPRNLGPSCIRTRRDARIFLRNFRPEIFLPNFRPRECPVPVPAPPPQPRRDAELASYLRKLLRANSRGVAAHVKSIPPSRGEGEGATARSQARGSIWTIRQSVVRSFNPREDEQRCNMVP